jgi:uncharacterized protein (UPF0332 family)
LQQKNGLELVEPSNNLREAYNIKAEEALETLRATKSRDWRITTAYYTIYHGVYSLLMKIGVKSEIHSCTIEFVKRFLRAHFSEEDFGLIDTAFEARICSQYYVNKEVPDEKYDLILKKAPLFLVKCKNIVLDQTEIREIRKKMSSLK